MARINLLPWREELRKQRQRDFGVAAMGSVMVTVLVVIYIHIHINGMIDNQRSRNSYLTKQISLVDQNLKKIKNLEDEKKKLLARMKIIERLQRNRPEIVHLFDALVKATPDGLYLTSLKQKAKSLTITGEANSNARVSAFMRNLDASHWFDNPVLDVIKTGGKGDARTREFTLQVTQASEKDE